MSAQAGVNRREGGKPRLLPVVIALLTLMPNAFVTSAAAQSFNSAHVGPAPIVPVGGAAASITAVPTSLAPSLLTVSALPLSVSALNAAPAAIAAMPTAQPSSRSAIPAPAPASVVEPDGWRSGAAVEAAAPVEAARQALAGDSRGRGTESAKLDAAFDGTKSVDPGSLSIFLVRPGQAPLRTTMAELDVALKADPALAKSLNSSGKIRIVFDKSSATLGEADLPRIEASLRALGVAAAVQRENLTPAAAKPAAPKASPSAERPAAPVAGKGVLSALTWPLREAAFLARTFVASYSRPLTSEVLGGIATKSFPLVTSIGVYWATIGLAHPLALVGLVTLNLFQETFHGIFLNTWNNFQENLSRLRGFSYQLYFNLAYFQGFGSLYRVFAWTANPDKIIPPWSPLYWKDILVMSLIGTFCGTMGYNGLNDLYAKGRIVRWQRSAIQQLRDTMFLLAGPFFATGAMYAFWGVFIFQQSLDLAIAIIAWRAKTRPILYVVDGALADTPEFKAKYPAALGLPQESPLHQAWNAIAGNPLLKLIALPLKFLWKLAKRARGRPETKP